MLEPNHIYCGNCIELMRSMPPDLFDCCVTSPPYWGLRDYGVDGNEWDEVAYMPIPGMTPVTVPAWHGCLGLEPTPEMYVAHVVEVFREVRRVLKPKGMLWLNFGDSYSRMQPDNVPQTKNLNVQPPSMRDRSTGLKPKDLVGIPWRVAFALQADGWYLRSDIIWHKPNPMPESVTDRPTKAHEYVFLMSKSAEYYYDAAAIKEPAQYSGKPRPFGGAGNGKQNKDRRDYEYKGDTEYRNKRSVWTVATQPFPEAHFATFPPKLIEPCILAGCPAGGIVLDPFMGAGTTALVALKLGRRFVGCELKQEYTDMANNRIKYELSQTKLDFK